MSTRIFIAGDQDAANGIADDWKDLPGTTIAGIGPADQVQLAEANGNELWSGDGPLYVVIVTTDPVSNLP
jgi:hypothetical protein